MEKFTKRDVCLWDGKKATEQERQLVKLGQEKGSLCLLIDDNIVTFVPMNGANGLKPVDSEFWVKLPYGTEVELELAKMEG